MHRALLLAAAGLAAACSGASATPSARSDGGARGLVAGASVDGAAGGDDAGALPGEAAADDGGAAELVTYGSPYTGGQYNLGPVDYTETQFHNACAPLTMYDPRVQSVEGSLLAGLWDGVSNVASDCDACIWVVTAAGKSAMLRVVTYGQTTTDSIDTSPSAYALLDSGEYPRTMTWQLAKCPDSGPMMYEFQTASSEWWTSLWVRNARVPLAGVEVQSENHPQWTALARGSDGTLTDASGFGVGTFSIRSTGVDGQQVVDTFAWPTSGVAGAFLVGQGNFR